MLEAADIEEIVKKAGELNDFGKSLRDELAKKWNERKVELMERRKLEPGLNQDLTSTKIEIRLGADKK
jgi:hypothetical protein